jgi:hypothetical protein
MLNQLVTRSDKDHPWTYSPVKYWPPNNEKLSFFAITYGPAVENGVSLVTDDGTSYTGYPAFKVTPPTSPSQQKDIGVASALNHTQEDGAVPLTFNHAMAKVKFSAKYTSLTNADLNVSIEKIEFTNLYESNTLRIVAQNPGFQWDVFDASNNPARANYTLTQTDNTLANNTLLNRTTPTTISTEDGTLMLIPQKDPSGAKLKVSFKMEGIDFVREVEPSIDFAAGESYVYALNLDQLVWKYGYTGAEQTFTAPKTGTYKLEVWGASGFASYNPGNGGYSVGNVDLNVGDVLSVYVGGTPPSEKVGGYNGGGSSANTNSDYASRAGGGATDIRIEGTTLFHRLIVAGGGGGGTRLISNKTHNYTGGAGGGTSGIDGTAQTYAGRGIGGTQTAGGVGGSYNSSQSGLPGNPGTFGVGGSHTDGRAGAGGGGWYGGGTGGSGYLYVCAGGGGSGWVFTANTYTAWQSGNPTDASQYQVPTTYYLTDAATVAGSVTNGMPNPTATGSMTGNTGNGYARITRLN